jgi:hypothetical protein
LDYRQGVILSEAKNLALRQILRFAQSDHRYRRLKGALLRTAQAITLSFLADSR